MRPILVLQHAWHETLGSLQNVFRACNLSWGYVPLQAQVPLALPLHDIAGLVVLGGPMNVDETDRYPFLRPEVEWIRDALGAGIPVLGICLGAQLLAKAAGARVYPNQRKEIGWYEIELTREAASDPLFSGCEPRGTVFQWHGDTFDLPKGAVHLAQSETCRHQAFRCGRCAWGLQFHVEMTAALIECWLDDPDNRRELDGLEYINPRAIRAGITRRLAAMEDLGQRVLPQFAKLCQTRSA